MSGKEKTFNDSYLITDETEEKMRKFSYQSNLLEAVKEISPNSYDEAAEVLKSDKDSFRRIRRIAKILEKDKCAIYQLTRL